MSIARYVPITLLNRDRTDDSNEYKKVGGAVMNRSAFVVWTSTG